MGYKFCTKNITLDENNNENDNENENKQKKDFFK